MSRRFCASESFANAFARLHEIERGRRELIDAKIEIHRQRVRAHHLAQQAAHGGLLIAGQLAIGVRGVHEQIGDEGQAVGVGLFHAGANIPTRAGAA